MNKTQAQKNIKYELKKLNALIDSKIIKGQPYHKEALRHRALLSQIKWLEYDSPFFFSWRYFNFK